MVNSMKKAIFTKKMLRVIENKEISATGDNSINSVGSRFRIISFAVRLEYYLRMVLATEGISTRGRCMDMGSTISPRIMEVYTRTIKGNEGQIS